MYNEPSFAAVYPQPVELLLEYQEAVRNIEAVTESPSSPKSPAHYAFGRCQEVWQDYSVNYQAGRDVRWEMTIFKANVKLMLDKAMGL